MEGRFYDAAGYSPAARDPYEIAGTGIIVDSSDGTGDLHLAFSAYASHFVRRAINFALRGGD